MTTSGPPFSIAMLAACPFPTRQGTQVLIRHLATALARAGHRVHLITYGYGEYEEDFEFAVHRSARVDAGLRSGPNLVKPAADAALVMTAARVAQENSCDLWHAHNVEGLGLGAWLKLRTGLPLVYHAHNAMGPELPTYFRAPLAQAVASVVGDVLDRTLPRAADAVITFDEDHKALHEVYGMDERRLHVIPPGLDGQELTCANSERVARLKEELGPGPWLLYSGNPDRYQNLPLMWRALALVQKKNPAVRLLVASSHPASVFEREYEANGAPTGVTFKTIRHVADLQDYLALADLGLSPRTLWTGAPIKILNYLAAGLPTVACRSAARHVLPPSGGDLVEGTPEAFAEAILKRLGKRRRLKKLSLAGFTRYEIRNHIPLYEDLYRSVLGLTPAE